MRGGFVPADASSTHGNRSGPLSIEETPMRILVVDDQITVGLALCGTLEQLGHEPHLVTSSFAALEFVEAQRSADGHHGLDDARYGRSGALPQNPRRQEAPVYVHPDGNGPDRSP